MTDEPRSSGTSAAGARFWLVDDPLFLEHRARGYHPERPERLLAARRSIEALRAEGATFQDLAPRDASREEIERVHTPAYLETLAEADGLFAALDDDTYLAPKSVAAATRAAGGAIAMVESILANEGPAKGVALLRPPGHHARPSGGMGFCLLNNVALAAKAALAKGLSRVAIVDWDVHHGNGTQEAFYSDPHVLFTSLHQWPFYPGTGLATEIGEGEGKGYTVNVPLTSNAGDATYDEAFHRIILPVLEAYRPELILISAGFDAHARDPLASMRLTAPAYRRMAREVAAVADRTASGRVGVVLEGGYDLGGLSDSLTATLEGLAHPALEPAEDKPAHSPPSQRHSQDVERARKAASDVWKL